MKLKIDLTHFRCYSREDWKRLVAGRGVTGVSNIIICVFGYENQKKSLIFNLNILKVSNYYSGKMLLFWSSLYPKAIIIFLLVSRRHSCPFSIRSMVWTETFAIRASSALLIICNSLIFFTWLLFIKPFLINCHFLSKQVIYLSKKWYLLMSIIP